MSTDEVISVQSVSPGNHSEVPGPSTVTPAVEFDWLYASWLCDEVDPADYESMSDGEIEVPRIVHCHCLIFLRNLPMSLS
jgi:hypothetical protein